MSGYGRGEGASDRDETADATLLRAILDALPARIVVLDEEHRYVFVNAEALTFVGLSASDVIGRHASEIVGEEAYAQMAPIARRAAAGETVLWEGWRTYAFGQVYVELVFTPYRRKDGHLNVVALTRDLTALKLREAELEAQHAALDASEALNSAIVASALDCVIVTDEAGRVVEFNPAAESTFGYSRQEAVGNLVGDLIVPASYRHRHANGMERYLSGGDPRVIGRRVELEAMKADGTIFPVEMTLTEVRLPSRRLFTAHLRDLTAAREAQAEILAQRERLHQVEKLSAMGSLLAGVAHELNNPLAILLAQATLLQEKASSDDVRRRAERIHAAAERSGRIVKSFLAMARQKPPQRGSVDLRVVAANAVEMLSYGLRSHGVEVSIDAPSDLPPVEADQDLIGQVVANLLINAQQALTGRTDPRIWVTIAAVRDGVVLKVADNGPGVPADLEKRIFEPFFTTKAVGVGTGIGLSICRNVIGAHRGRITVEPHEGGGAVFSVLLPCRKELDPRSVSEPSLGSAKLSVLVVDDEVDVGQSLVEILESFGHRAHVVERDGQALDAIARERFDVLFADLRMPGLGGLALRDRLSVVAPDLAARTVIMTGDTVAGADMARAGPDGRETIVLEKPFTPNDVRSCLTQAAAIGVQHELQTLRSARP